MKKDLTTQRYMKQGALISLLAVGLLASCGKEERLVADYEAPSELPAELVTGTPLGDSIAALYERYGVVVFTNPESPRFNADLVSKEALSLLEERQPADTAAALFALKMIERELYDVLPAGSKKYMPRNFYLLKPHLIYGTVSTQYFPHSYLWENSMGDVTLGGLDKATLDTTFFKGALFYAMAGILRQVPEYTTIYANFIGIKNDAGVYYWQVTDLESAYELGFVSADQSEISSNDFDFQLMAAWGATVDPDIRDASLAGNPLLASKYTLVADMFRLAGIPLNEVNAKWQESTLNPKNQ